MNTGFNFLIYYYGFEKYEKIQINEVDFDRSSGLFPTPGTPESLIRIGVNDPSSLNKLIIPIQIGFGYFINNNIEIELNANHSIINVFSDTEDADGFDFKLLDLNLGVKYYMTKNNNKIEQ